MYYLSKRSIDNLNGVKAELKILFLVAICESPYDFLVTEGVRSIERQRELVAKGKSKTMNSYHLSGRAVDICVLINGKANWDFDRYESVAKHIKKVAKNMGLNITWGGDWKFRDACHFQLEENRDAKLQLKETDKFMLTEDFSTGVIDIEKGFVSDLASIPKFLWSLLSPLENTGIPSLVHDFLYSSENKDFTRAEADKIFLEEMKKYGVSFLKRNIIYLAVRCFGKFFFKGAK